ncbi:MAG: protein kinase [Pirellulales bacterium]|nr:protein kinase [Pirellulales bacterium]
MAVLSEALSQVAGGIPQSPAARPVMAGGQTTDLAERSAILLAVTRQLIQALSDSGWVCREDLESLLANLPPDRRLLWVHHLVHCLAQRFRSGGPIVEGEMESVPLQVLGEFLLLEQIGRGGMGTVHRALDMRQDRCLALKVLPDSRMETVHYFKQEFRALAELVHPNLVVLEELHTAGGRWFFTMELVEGCDFCRYVRGKDAPPGEASWETVVTELFDRPAVGATRAEALREPAQFDRLHAAMVQLCEGVAFLHRAGKLHRDIKPSNVLVTAEGRVVLVDFGLVSELGRLGSQVAGRRMLMGTLPYMSPEQVAEQALSEASDWYSVGILLYEALCGKTPFEGDIAEVIAQKSADLPPLSSDSVPPEHRDLVALVSELLRPKPLDRPTADQILERLSGRPACKELSRLDVAAQCWLLGRERECEELAVAYRSVKAGAAVSLFVHGEPGVGKTALVQHFLDLLEVCDGVRVFRGRCYERESVPYNALDSLVDTLAEHLAGRPPIERLGFLPNEVGPLLRIFPAFRRVGGIWAGLAESRALPDNAADVYRSAVESLRQMLGRLAARAPIALFVDDLQWGDLDSAVLLSDLFRPPRPPRFLFVGCSRSGAVSDSLCVDEMRTRLASLGAEFAPREVFVEPLAPGAARHLAETLLYPLDRGGEEAVTELVHHSGGNPHLLTELVGHVRRNVSPGTAMKSMPPINLAAAFQERIARLSPAAREFLDVVVTAGHPLRILDACRAAEVVPDSRMIAVLRDHCLIRTRGLGALREVRIYHDRIREALDSQLPEEKRRLCHLRIGTVLADSPHADPQLAHSHFAEAEQRDKGGEKGVRDSCGPWR